MSRDYLSRDHATVRMRNDTSRVCTRDAFIHINEVNFHFEIFT